MTVGSKCYYRWDFYYAWVQMLLQIWQSLYVYLTSRVMSPSGARKKWTGKNITESRNGYQFKLWQIYNWLWNVLLNKIHRFRRNRYVIRVLLYKHDVRLINSFQPRGICYYFFSSVFPFVTNFIDRISWLSVLVPKRSTINLKLFLIH